MAKLNWNAIRELNGSQAMGFEELCAQLARAETPEAAKFVRKGSPDSGVECYCILPDGSEWGWQAKYFTASMTDSQWHQLDNSVKRALEGHPNLVRYYVCIAHDRADGRRPNKSEKEHWDERVKKWEGWARDRGMNVEFIWWGSSELWERLSKPEHIGRTFFWFGGRGFDEGWFQTLLDDAIRAAGARYTPELHVDLPIAQELQMFERSEEALQRVKSWAIPLSRALEDVRLAQRTVEKAGEHVNLDDFLQHGQAILNAIRALSYAPDTAPATAGIVASIDETEPAMSDALDSIRALESAKRANAEEGRSRYTSSPSELLQGMVRQFLYVLSDVREGLASADAMTNKSVMILSGPAGVGKTHLLCDFAKRRIAAGAPTVLLMGQRFLGSETAWTQALGQMDMSNATAEQFVGALEAAAQAADSRALFVVDALNEGQGPVLWPNELAPFLNRLAKSPWIGVVLSVREPYGSNLIPEEIRNDAVAIRHEGFGDQEYDAVRSFFDYHGLELPSAPILQPEFRNPQFLKIICKGLQESGQQRLPTGFHGISAAFALYLNAINGELAKRLDFDLHQNLVGQAMGQVAARIAEDWEQRLSRSAVQSLVDGLLPGREYSRSLYAALVSEGILSEDVDWRSSDSKDYVAYISYERLGDHLVVDHLLRTHLDPIDPQEAFAEGSGLAFIRGQSARAPIGVIEAMCAQIPEHTGKELARLAPELMEDPNFGYVFVNSIIWRSLTAFTDDTHNVFNELAENEQLALDDVLDSLLIVAAVPGHPFNALLLDERLRRESMPERDSRWSMYLHRQWRSGDWGTKGAVHRLVDWAEGVSDANTPEDEVIHLAAITLAWMLTTPNRHLRDRATKAMVSLLTDRLDAAGLLVERFADVDDPYVAERVYAVAYGVAMRSRDAEGITVLASVVYQKVFASGSPPAHVLLRDYARGVVERAIHLRAAITIDEALIRPPYRSVWPNIPSEENVLALFPDLSGGAHDGGDLEWSRNRIRNSVTGDFGDFGIYVIGSPTNLPWGWPKPENESIWQGDSMEASGWHVSVIRRYIQWRVFDLGWTIERFGEFDRFTIGLTGRHASKPERMGKKYQWIAYHEILAYLSDYFQFRKGYSEDGNAQQYEGPWQLHIRDIDPSCTLRDTPGGTGWGAHALAWWGQAPYTEWGGESRQKWIEDKQGIPSAESFLQVTKPKGDIQWLNVNGFYMWREPRRADVDPREVVQRELWMKCVAYVGDVDEIDAWIDSAENAIREGGSLPEAPMVLPQHMFLGEYGWAPAFRHVTESEDMPPGWNELNRDEKSREIRVFTATYLAESGGYDCSLDDTYTIQLPHPDFLAQVGARWSGGEGDFVDESGHLAAFDPTAHEDGPSATLIREDLLRKYLEEKKMSLCWIVSGEKWTIGGDIGSPDRSRLVISGSYKLTDDGLRGNVNYSVDP